MPVEIRFVRPSGNGTSSPARPTSILFGGARGGAKTTGSLLDFWYHAIEHGPNARGLMVRKQRTDLKDTQLAAMTMYGNAAEWKEHGSLFPVPERRPAVVRLSGEREGRDGLSGFQPDACLYRGGRPIPILDPMWKLMATLRSTAGVKCQMRMTANPGGPSISR